jgi:FtsH-binding integral membrane protein
VWLFNRELRKRKGQQFYWLYLLVGLVCTAALITVFALSDRIAGASPQATWFVIVFVIAALALGLWWGGRNDPAIRWLFDRVFRRHRS